MATRKKRMKIDHKQIESLVMKYKKDSTVLKHYVSPKGYGEPAQRSIRTVIANVRKRLKAESLGLAQDGIVEAKTKKYRYNHPELAAKFREDLHNAPQWVVSASKVLKTPMPLDRVHKLLNKYDKRESDATNRIKALKKELVAVEARQNKYQGRIKVINDFLAGKGTITIVEWVLEDG